MGQTIPFSICHWPQPKKEHHAGLNPSNTSCFIANFTNWLWQLYEKIMNLSQSLQQWDVLDRTTGKLISTPQEDHEEEHVCCAFSCHHQPQWPQGLLQPTWGLWQKSLRVSVSPRADLCCPHTSRCCSVLLRVSIHRALSWNYPITPNTLKN